MLWGKHSPRTVLSRKADQAAKKRDEVVQAVVRYEGLTTAQILDFLLKPTKLSRQVLRSLTDLSRVGVTRDEVIEKLAWRGQLTVDRFVKDIALCGKLTPEVITGISGRDFLHPHVSRLIEERSAFYREVLDASREHVRKVAWRVTHNPSQVKDLFGIGIETIYNEVLDRYDPARSSKDNSFEVYSWQALTGAYSKEMKNNPRWDSLNNPVNGREDSGEEMLDLIADPNTPLFHHKGSDEDVEMAREVLRQISNDAQRRVLEMDFLGEDIGTIAKELKLKYNTAKNYKLRGHWELKYLFWRMKLQGEPLYAPSCINVLEAPVKFSTCSIRLNTIDVLVTRLLDSTPLSLFLRAQWEEKYQDKLEECAKANSVSAMDRANLRRTAQRMLMSELNKLLDGPYLYDSQGFEVRSEEARKDRSRDPQREELTLLNRLLLEEEYPEGIRSREVETQEIREVWRLYVLEGMEPEQIKRRLNLDISECSAHLEHGAEQLPLLFEKVLSTAK